MGCLLRKIYKNSWMKEKYGRGLKQAYPAYSFSSFRRIRAGPLT